MYQKKKKEEKRRKRNEVKYHIRAYVLLIMRSNINSLRSRTLQSGEVAIRDDLAHT